MLRVKKNQNPKEEARDLKNRFAIIAWALLLSVCLLLPDSAQGKPEQIELKSEEVKSREARAEALIQGIDLSKIEDPETRLALQAILYTMDLGEETPGEEIVPEAAPAPPQGETPNPANPQS